MLTAVLNRMVRIALTGWMTFDQRPEELEGIWGRNEGGHVSQGGRAGWENGPTQSLGNKHSPKSCVYLACLNFISTLFLIYK